MEQNSNLTGQNSGLSTTELMRYSEQIITLVEGFSELGAEEKVAAVKMAQAAMEAKMIADMTRFSFFQTLVRR